MKEMVYKYNKGFEVLDKGIHDGYNYYIVSFGTHPCAYVVLPPTNQFYGKHYDEIPIDVHGGLTFGCSFNPNINEMCIGWDYSHVGDYCSYFPNSDEHKWTTQEIRQDVYNVIKQLKDYEQN